MKIFLDAEFTDFQNSKLISAGFVTDAGEELYVELTDTWREKDCSTFVLDTVLPLLEGGDVAMTEAEAAGWLRTWIESFGQPVLIISDAPQLDWPLITHLLRDGWPKNLATHCASMLVDDYDYFEENPDATRHHALHDARAFRTGYQRLFGGVT
ncbi:MAG: hypothetical protein U1C96_07200 [Gallionella sp.]|nr:hypothetical protein [Gallionella sp.]